MRILRFRVRNQDLRSGAFYDSYRPILKNNNNNNEEKNYKSNTFEDFTVDFDFILS